MRLIDANAFSEMLEARANMAVGMPAAGVFYSAKKMVDAMPTVVVMQTLSLNALRDAVYQDAVAHGLWESTDYTVQYCIDDCLRNGDPFDPDEIMRDRATDVISMEVYRLEAACGEEAYAENLADVVIAAMSVAGKLGIDIDKAVRRKMEINRARPWKHGKEDNA